FSGVASTSSVMPAVVTQKRRFDAWRAFWTKERRGRVRADLAAAAAEFGIKASTFEPFFASLETTPSPLVPENLAGTPLEAVVGRHLSVRPGDVLGLVVISGSIRTDAGQPPPVWPDRVRAAVPEAKILS